MSIGERIKERRIELGLTQAELAERMGYKSRAAICAVEKDKEDLTTDRIMRYAKALNTSVGYLMEWADEITPEPLKNPLGIDYTIYKKKTEEDELIEAFRELNEVGQEEAIKRVKELSYNPLYTSKNYSASRDTA